MDDTLITTLEDYKESYNIRLDNHLKEYVDYDELHFIKKELELYNSYFDSTNIKRFDIALGSNPKQPFHNFEYRTEKENVVTSNPQLLRMIFDFDKYEIKYDNLELADFYNDMTARPCAKYVAGSFVWPAAQHPLLMFA